jgi:hypothetical protein
MGARLQRERRGMRMLSALLGEGGDWQHSEKSASCGIPLSRRFTALFAAFAAELNRL